MQRLSFDALSDVTVVLEVRQSIVIETVFTLVIETDFFAQIKTMHTKKTLTIKNV